MKDNMQFSGCSGEPLSANRQGRQHDALLGVVASRITRDGFMDIGFAGLMERLSFEKIAENGLADTCELVFFYRTPEGLLNTLFETMLRYLEIRISHVAADDDESLGRFERAYRTVISGRSNLAPMILCGLDGALVSRLFFLFMSVMDHESRNGTSFILQQRWMSWYNRQIALYDEAELITAIA